MQHVDARIGPLVKMSIVILRGRKIDVKCMRVIQSGTWICHRKVEIFIYKIVRVLFGAASIFEL